MSSGPQPRGARITPAPRVVTLESAGRIVLIDGDVGRRVTLDPFGSRVWRLVADCPMLPALMERLRDDAVRSEQLAEDLALLLSRWREMGVIVWR